MLGLFLYILNQTVKIQKKILKKKFKKVSGGISYNIEVKVDLLLFDGHVPKIIKNFKGSIKFIFEFEPTILLICIW